MSDSNHLTFRGWVAMLLFMGTSVFPASGMAGFFFDYGLNLAGLIVLSLVGGAISGLVFDRWNLVARLVAGALMGPGAALAIYFWCLGREEIWNFEPILVGFVGGLPGLGAGWVLNKALGDPTNGVTSYGIDPQGYPYFNAQLPPGPPPAGQFPPYPGDPYGANPAPPPSPGFTFGNYPPDPRGPRPS